MSDHREGSTMHAHLAAQQSVVYAAAIEHTEALFALEKMATLTHDKYINAAILAGKVSLKQARADLLAYIIEHRTLKGF